MVQELKTIKFQMMLSESDAKAIDDWGFAHRIGSRAKAIRRLVEIGMIWDEQKDRLTNKVRSTIEQFASEAEDALSKVGDLDGVEDQAWVKEYVEASTATLLNVESRLASVWRILRFIELPSEMLKTGDIDDDEEWNTRYEAKTSELEISNETLRTVRNMLKQSRPAEEE